MENRVYYGKQLQKYLTQLKTSEDFGVKIVATAQIKMLCKRMDIPLESMEEILGTSQALAIFEDNDDDVTISD